MSESEHPGHWFEPLADHLGSAYLRYSFTRGTRQEVDALWSALDLSTGSRVLDVGCGPGRHSLELAARGAVVTGLDISQRFVDIAREHAPPNATFVRGDARSLPFDQEFDAVVSLCQGAFGLNRGPEGAPGLDPEAPGPDPDESVLAGMHRSLRPGGRLALTAFSAYFQVRYLEAGDEFDAGTGVNHERTSVRSEDGAELPADLWTTCFTPRELRMLAERTGLEIDDLWAVAPGDYRPRPPDLEHPELLLLAHRPA